MLEPNQRADVVPVGPMYSAGEAAQIPQGRSRKLRNVIRLPSRYAARPPYTYDSQMAVRGLGLWEDKANKATRLFLLKASALAVKGVTGETWGADVSASGTVISDFESYKGQLFVATYTGTSAYSQEELASYNGTTFRADSSTKDFGFRARTLTAFMDRIFYGAPRLVADLVMSVSESYDLTVAAWVKTGLTATLVTQGTGIVCRLLPTSTTAANALWNGSHNNAAATVEKPLVFLSMLKGVDPTYRVPLTIQVIIRSPAARSTVYVAGDLVTADGASAGNGHRYRCTTGGTSAAVAPSFGTTVGGTTADGGVTWTNEGSDVIAAREIDLPSASDTPYPTPTYVKAMLPIATNTVTYKARIKWGNSAVPTGWTLAAVNASYRDGLADTDPRKNNFGQQLTAAPYLYPFRNTEAGTTIDISENDLIIWSEIAAPLDVPATNFYRLSGVPAANLMTTKVVGGKFVAFCRRVAVIFSGTDRADAPLLREAILEGIGCIGPKAIDVFEGYAYLIGDDEVYRWRPGGEAEPLCGDGMREEIMSRGSGWVETNGATNAQAPLLVVDQTRRLVYVYTQKSKLYVYRLRHGAADPDPEGWSYIDLTGIADGEISDIAYHPGTKNVYAAFRNYGLARLDPTLATKDSIDNTVNTYDVTAEITLRAFESDPPRQVFMVEEVGIHGLATASQASQTTEVEVSVDGGETFPKENVVRLLTGTGKQKKRTPVPLWQGGENLVLNFKHVGSGGETNFSFSSLDALLQILSDQIPEIAAEIPTQVSSTL